jgi:aminopeptidase N
MYKIKIPIIYVFLSFFSTTTFCQGNFNEDKLDVINYHLTIEPEIDQGFIKGTVILNFRIAPNANSIVLNSGNLQIDQVKGKSVVGFKKKADELTIELSEREKWDNEITIDYHGNPTRGLLFNSELGQAYTAYFTSQWMVCNDLPSDKATLNLNLLIPQEKRCVASGELIETVVQGKKTLFQWSQQYETPAYTYGFAIGNFKETGEKQGEIKLNYYSDSRTADQLKKVFRETGNILRFFELKSGVKYVQNSYSQILIGDHYQEMSGFSVLKDSYASSVLKDSSEIHLTSHELAHQWWGNMITCKSFQHFWLNEAFATYMSAAFSEYKFGKDKYESDISIYKGIYDKLLTAGKDKPLVFPNWDNPSRDDRNIVYYKGAYVLHLLRQELGDKDFWKGIKSYSQKNFGKSVVTADFQLAMEESTNKNLDAFFNEWIYEKER